MLCSNDCSLMSNIAVKALWYNYWIEISSYRSNVFSPHTCTCTRACTWKILSLQEFFLDYESRKKLQITASEMSIFNFTVSWTRIQLSPQQVNTTVTGYIQHCNGRDRKKGLKTRLLHFINFQHYRGCSILFFCIRPIMLWGLLACWLE